MKKIKFNAQIRNYSSEEFGGNSLKAIDKTAEKYCSSQSRGNISFGRIYGEFKHGAIVEIIIKEKEVAKNGP